MPTTSPYPATSMPVNTPQTSVAAGPRQDLNPANDLLDYLKNYAREKPDMAALWCFGIGFIVGWKMKMW